jgi:catechol 2,3-dioxygenase-like lactoylglutathione lyase family enzyme
MQVGNSLVTIMVGNMDRSVSFYTETLGMPLRFRAGNDWAEVTSPGVKIGLHPARPGAPPSANNGGMSLGFEIDNLETAMDDLRARGVDFPAPIIEGGGERIANFADPDGTPLYLYQQRRGG